MTAIDLLGVECGPEVAWVAWMENPRSRQDDGHLGADVATNCAQFIARPNQHVPSWVPIGGVA